MYRDTDTYSVRRIDVMKRGVAGVLTVLMLLGLDLKNNSLFGFANLQYKCELYGTMCFWAVLKISHR